MGVKTPNTLYSSRPWIFHVEETQHAALVCESDYRQGCVAFRFIGWLKQAGYTVCSHGINHDTITVTVCCPPH